MCYISSMRNYLFLLFLCAASFGIWAQDSDNKGAELKSELLLHLDFNSEPANLQYAPAGVPIGVANLDAEKNIYILDYLASRVIVFTNKGEYDREIQLIRYLDPYAIWIDSAGDICLLGSDGVSFYSGRGELLAHFKEYLPPSEYTNIFTNNELVLQKRSGGCVHFTKDAIRSETAMDFSFPDVKNKDYSYLTFMGMDYKGNFYYDSYSENNRINIVVFNKDRELSQDMTKTLVLTDVPNFHISYFGDLFYTETIGSFYEEYRQTENGVEYIYIMPDGLEYYILH